MDTSFIDSTTAFNPSLHELDDEDISEPEEKTESNNTPKKRYNGEARRKVEEYIEMKDLKKLTQDLFLDNNWSRSLD